MSDLVKRLRSVNSVETPYANDLVRGWCHEAADYIETLAEQIYDSISKSEANDMQARIDALEAENKALREGLRACLNYLENTESELGITLSSADRARALLEKEKTS